MSGFDLSNLDSKAAAESGARIELTDPRDGESPLLDDEGTPYYLDIIGIDSAKLRNISKRVVERRIGAIRKGRTEYDADAEEAERARLYAAATTGWYLPTLDGKTLEFSEKAARSLYSDERFPWLVEQIDKAIADRQRFFKKASAS